MAPKEIAPVRECTWSPHGLCLFFWPGEVAVAAALPGSVDLWGSHVRLVRSAGETPDWSPDGTRVACSRTARGQVDGEPGYWRRLLVMDADGSAPRVPVEQFIADAQLDAHCPGQEMIELAPTYDWRKDVLWWAGPHWPKWSPRGDRIAFLAALPFDPAQMTYNRQVDAWVYDLVAHRLTKITNAPTKQYSLSWR